MSSKKRQKSNRTNPKSTKGEKSYKYFVFYCIILLIGIFLPQYFGIYYLDFSFLYVIVLPICFTIGLYFKYVKKYVKQILYMTLWGVFCTAFSLYTVVNVVYTELQDTHSFTSEIESVASSGYRSPASIYFKLDNGGIALIVRNEYTIKEKMEQGCLVKISGQYKKGLLSSVMIIDYTIY